MFCPKCGTENPETGRFCRSCGVGLSNVSTALKPSLTSTYVDHKGRVRSNDPSDVISNAIRNSMMGVGFLVISAVLFLTGVAGGHNWWWAMLFPGFSMLATGVSQFFKYREMNGAKATAIQQNAFSQTENQPVLPPTQSAFIQPQGSIYDTDNLAVPVSVTENTTRHLDMNTESETMTLNQKD